MLLRSDKLSRWLYDIIPLLCWMVLIFILSAQARLIKIEDELDEKLVYKLAHIIAYAVLAWLWWRALAPHRQFTWPNLFIAFSLSTLYGVSDEIHQLFVPGRHGRVADVLFDASGALLTIILIRRIKWLRTSRGPSAFDVPLEI